MFQAIRKHLNPTTVVAFVALVFAMTGGAFAASGGSGGGGTGSKTIASVTRGAGGNPISTTAKSKAKPKTKAGPRGPAGPAGKNGATGVTGPAGPAGATGAKGETVRPADQARRATPVKKATRVLPARPASPRSCQKVPPSMARGASAAITNRKKSSAAAKSTSRYRSRYRSRRLWKERAYTTFRVRRWPKSVTKNSLLHLGVVKATTKPLKRKKGTCAYSRRCRAKPSRKPARKSAI